MPAIFRVLRNEPVYSGGGAGSGFKDKIGPFLDRLDGSAETIGSVNVIARDQGGFAGYNTDGAGFVAGLLDQYPDCIAGKKIVILGAGGTALPMPTNWPSEAQRRSSSSTGQSPRPRTLRSS